MAAENRKGQFVKREREPGTAQQYNQQAAADAGVGMGSHGFAPTPSKQPGRWRVTKGGRFYTRYGAMAYLKEGDLVLLAAHGRDGVDRILGGGIELQPLD